MGYRVCKSTGVIHACGENCKKACVQSQKINVKNYADYRTNAEAEAAVRETKKPPRYCKRCDFRDALQEEANR